MYQRDFVCEDCGEVGISKSASKKRCSRCQAARERELKAKRQSEWRKKSGRCASISFNADPNYETAIYNW